MKRQSVDAWMVVTDAETITLRDVAGAGQQVQVDLKTKRGTLTIRVVSRAKGTLRVVDLRKRDKERHRKSQFISVPMTEVGKGAGHHG